MSMANDETMMQLTHESNLREDPEYRSNHLNQMVSERISPSGDCYPWTPDNVAEALSNSDLTELTELLKNSNLAVTYRTRGLVNTYWHNMARTLCERELDK